MCQLLVQAQQRSKMEDDIDWNSDEYLAMVSHELRTPTTAILGWAELLSRKQANNEIVVRGAEVIRRNARLQAQLIEQLLDYSRVCAGCLILNTQRVELGPV